MNYTLNIRTLVEREQIRSDQVCDFMNTMTDDEIKQYRLELREKILHDIETETDSMSTYSNRHITAEIDRDILFNLFKFGKVKS